MEGGENLTADLKVLKINSAYEAVLPQLPKEEFEALKLSIEKEGQHFPIIVNEDLEILDGLSTLPQWTPLLH